MKHKILVISLILVFTKTVSSQIFEEHLKRHMNEQESVSPILQKKFLMMAESFREYSGGKRNATEDEIKLIDELYLIKDNSDEATNIRSFAFGAMVHVKDVKVWSAELPDLLTGESSKMRGVALGAIHYTMTKGSKTNKLFLLNDKNLTKTITEMSKDFTDENNEIIFKKVSKLLSKMKVDSTK
jgi:hypothetical protein